MRGSTRRRGSTWTAYWDTPPKADGARVQRSKGGFATRRAAQAHLAQVVVAVGQGTYSEPSRTPLARYLEEWLAGRDDLRDQSRDRYAAIIRTHIAARDIGGIALRDLRPGHFRALYAVLRACRHATCPEHRGDCRGLAEDSRRGVHAVVRAALGDAERERLIAWNPAALVKAPAGAALDAQPGAHRGVVFTGTELRRFLVQVQHERLRALWRLAVTTGMRRGELAGLRWADIDFAAAELAVERQLKPNRAFGPPKSDNGARDVALDAGTVEVLREHRDAQLVERALAGAAYTDDDLVFCDELGERLRPQGLTESFARHRKAAGIPVGVLHDLRHTATTNALTAGVPLHIVAAHIGDDAKTLLRTYAHLLKGTGRMAAEAMAAQLVDKSWTTSDPQEVEHAV